MSRCIYCFFFFQAEDGIRDLTVTGVQTCALPISGRPHDPAGRSGEHAIRSTASWGYRVPRGLLRDTACRMRRADNRSEEHTSELQSQSNLVCRLLLEKKKTPGPHTRLRSLS